MSDVTEKKIRAGKHKEKISKMKKVMAKKKRWSLNTRDYFSNSKNSRTTNFKSIGSILRIRKREGKRSLIAGSAHPNTVYFLFLLFFK